MKNTSSPSQKIEIDLLQLCEYLWREKLLIIIITVSFALAGITFSITSPPKFQATANLIPLLPESRAKLEQLSLYSKISPETPLNEYLKILNNYNIREEFILLADENSRNSLYPSHEELVNLTLLSKNLQIHDNQTKDGQKVIFPYTIHLDAPSITLAEQELDRYLNFTAKKLEEKYRERYEKLTASQLRKLQQDYTLEELIATEQRNNEITKREEELSLNYKTAQLKLNIAINSAKAHYEDHIENLITAIQTAKTLNIKNPITLSNISGQHREITVDLSNNEGPLYLRGTKLLTAELEQLKRNSKGYKRTTEIIELKGQLAKLKTDYQIEQLKSRKSDLPFSDKLQAIKAQQHQLEAERFPELKLNFSQTPATANPNKLNPKTTLVVALSTLLGFILGIAVSLLKYAINNRKRTFA